ncbi:hypothetical protein E2C01_048225 [Portunus trituberculatus]|uniref:Uncharacterized protein n=1 Tax=Portunus trituberculatus TaxID=210409 RepID=A0A5B7GA92_PORTR|nr:hypothetical protein [Portunus trituberculatus]
MWARKVNITAGNRRRADQRELSFVQHHRYSIPLGFHWLSIPFVSELGFCLSWALLWSPCPSHCGNLIRVVRGRNKCETSFIGGIVMIIQYSQSSLKYVDSVLKMSLGALH